MCKSVPPCAKLQFLCYIATKRDCGDRFDGIIGKLILMDISPSIGAE
jgi:hypothetical protein